MVRHGRAMAQPVKLGLDNNRMVRIVSGVNPGQRVLLAPPLSAGQSATLAQVQHGAKIALKTGKGGAGVSTAKSGSKAGAGSGSSSAPTAADLLKKAEAHGYRPPTKKSIRARHADRIHHRGEAAPHHGGRPRHKALRHHQASHRSGHGKAGRRARERGK